MNDWTPVIEAIAGQIPVLVALLVFYVHWIIADSKRDQQNKSIIKEQEDVKTALNGTNHLIPKIDKNVEDVKDLLVEEKHQ